MPLPQSLQPFLPSSPVSNLDPQIDKAYIMENLLKKADLQSWNWMLSTYTKLDLISFIKTSRQLKPKDASFWIQYYQIPKSEVGCLQPKSQSIPKNSWAY